MNRIELLGKLAALVGKQVISLEHQDIPNCLIFNTINNTQPTRITISNHNISKTFSQYFLLKKLNSEKLIVLML
jgi:hypothetical protein